MTIGLDARMYGSKVTGIGNYVRDLAAALFALDDQASYRLFLRPEDYLSFRAPHPRIRAVQVSTPWYGWREQLIFPCQVALARCDLMHFPNFNVPLAYRGKFVVTIHDLTPLRFPGPRVARSRLRSYAYRLLLNSTLRRASAVISVSQHSAKEIITFAPHCRSKVTVIYPGLSPAFRRASNYGIVDERLRAYGIRQPYIFYVGVWRDHKNLPGLLDAFKILTHDNHQDLALVLCGSRENEDPKIAPRLAALPPKRVVTLGFVPDQDLPALYQGAAVTVIPSFNEGFGLVGLESLACGTPVVASTTTSLPEVLGAAARYFAPDNPRAMAETIAEVLRPEVREVLLASAATVVQRYQWAACARQTHDLYARVLEGRPSQTTSNDLPAIT